MIPFLSAGLSISSSSWFASAGLWQARPSLGRSCAACPGLLCPSQAASVALRQWPPPSVPRFGSVHAHDGARSPNLGSGRATARQNPLLQRTSLDESVERSDRWVRPDGVPFSEQIPAGTADCPSAARALRPNDHNAARPRVFVCLANNLDNCSIGTFAIAPAFLAMLPVPDSNARNRTLCANSPAWLHRPRATCNARQKDARSVCVAG